MSLATENLDVKCVVMEDAIDDDAMPDHLVEMFAPLIESTLDFAPTEEERAYRLEVLRDIQRRVLWRHRRRDRRGDGLVQRRAPRLPSRRSPRSRRTRRAVARRAAADSGGGSSDGDPPSPAVAVGEVRS